MFWIEIHLIMFPSGNLLNLDADQCLVHNIDDYLLASILDQLLARMNAMGKFMLNSYY